MNRKGAVDNLEKALIELEYASAEFIACSASEAERTQFGDLESLLEQLLKTSHAIQIVIGVLVKRYPDDASKRMR